MNILVVTDNLRGNRVWPTWFRSEGYDVACQDLRGPGLVLYPYAHFPVILMHLAASPIEQGLAAVRMFHTCHADSYIVAVIDESTDKQAFTEAGATVTLSEPTDHTLVFKMVDLLSRRVEQRPVKKVSLTTAQQHAPHLWEETHLAQPAE
jgi:DNA-binding response OmpR family regulator